MCVVAMCTRQDSSVFLTGIYKKLQLCVGRLRPLTFVNIATSHTVLNYVLYLVCILKQRSPS